MSDQKSTNKHDEPTSPRGVGKDVLASLILVVGALCIEWLKSLFPEGAPILLLIILNLSEITLIVGFIAALIRAITNALLEFATLARIIQRRKSLRAIRGLYKGEEPTTLEIIRDAVSTGVVFAFVAGILGILMIQFSSLAKVWLALLIIAGIVFSIFTFRRGGVFGLALFLADDGCLLMFSFWVFALFFLTASVFLFFQLSGQADLLHFLVNYFLLRH